MKKFLLIIAIICLCAGCQTKNRKDCQPNKNMRCKKNQLIGGWYPVFFNKYNKKKVNEIIDTIADGRAKRVSISYDENKKLADKILAAIQTKLNFAVEMKHVSPKDGSAKFDHSKVVVTIHLK
ncbi:MAG: hypothetical protein K9L78_04430 [Victivallales bacterium]|nr:hypothetical protein [Victivallales bacterium]MCF7889350.1 hypothetical protein [Victivallales bacterium]